MPPRWDNSAYNIRTCRKTPLITCFRLTFRLLGLYNYNQGIISEKKILMKARYRPYNPEEGYFTLIDPEDIKKHNPLLKAIDSFVEEHISVEPFSQSAR